MTLLGEIYTWTGSMAGTEVWERAAKQYNFDQRDPNYQAVKIKTRKAKLTAGQQYVLFLTVSKDYEQTDPGLLTKWGFINSDVLPGGDPVYINDSGDESQWTTQLWSIVGDSEFALQVKLK